MCRPDDRAQRLTELLSMCVCKCVCVYICVSLCECAAIDLWPHAKCHLAKMLSTQLNHSTAQTKTGMNTDQEEAHQMLPLGPVWYTNAFLCSEQLRPNARLTNTEEPSAKSVAKCLPHKPISWRRQSALEHIKRMPAKWINYDNLKWIAFRKRISCRLWKNYSKKKTHTFAYIRSVEIIIIWMHSRWHPQPRGDNQVLSAD